MNGLYVTGRLRAQRFLPPALEVSILDSPVYAHLSTPHAGGGQQAKSVVGSQLTLNPDPIAWDDSRVGGGVSDAAHIGTTPGTTRTTPPVPAAVWGEESPLDEDP